MTMRKTRGSRKKRKRRRTRMTIDNGENKRK